MQHERIIRCIMYGTFGMTLARVSQLLFMIDGETGFFKSDKNTTLLRLVTYAVMLLLGVGILLATGFCSRRQPTKAPDTKKSIPLAVMSGVMAVYCIYDSSSALLEGFNATTLVRAVISLVCVIFFSLYALSGTAKIKIPPILSVAPVFLMLYKTVYKFFSFNGMAVISENALEILLLAFGCIFFLLYSKILCDVTVRKASRQIFFVGAITFALSAVTFVSPLVVKAIGKGEILHSPTLEFENVLIGIYALVFVLSLYSKRNLNKRALPSVEKLDIDDANTENSFFYMGKGSIGRKKQDK